MDIDQNLDIEEALEAAGGWGRYQKILLFLSLIAAIPNAFTALHFVFSQYEPEHHCTYPDEFLEWSNESVSIYRPRATIIKHLPLCKLCACQRISEIYKQIRFTDDQTGYFYTSQYEIVFIGGEAHT